MSEVTITVTKKAPGTPGFRYCVVDSAFTTYGFGFTRRGAIWDWKNEYRKAMKKRSAVQQQETLVVRV